MDRGLDGVEFGDGICSDLLDCGLGCLDEMRDAPTCIDACRAEADREANVLFDDWRACVNEANCADPTDCGGCDQVEASCRSDRPSARRTSPDEP